MGRSPCCDKTKVKKGPWSNEEDALLINFVARYGNGGNWISLPKKAGLNRCGKSCRLRYLNYLKPDIKRGDFTEEEDYVICTLYNAIGSRWAIIASNLQGRTDNDVKNHWNTKLKKKLVLGKSNNKDTKIPITNNTTENTLNWQTLCNDENINSSDLIRSTNNNIGEGNEKPTQGYYNSSSSCSSATLEISSYSSSSSSSVQDSSGKMSELIAFSDEEDMFWMDLFAASFDDVVVGSQLEEKMSEIASLLVS